MPGNSLRITRLPCVAAASVLALGASTARAADAGATAAAARPAGSPTPSLTQPPLASDRTSMHARQRHWTEPFALDLSAATWIPLSAGPELALELPGRVIAQVHLGWMPELYSQTMTDALEDAGVYGPEIGDLVDGAVRGARTWRLAAGWRPFESAGLELTVGYAHVAVDGATNTTELVPLVPQDVGEELTAELGDANIDLDSSIHHFTLAVGWRWLVAEHLVVRANLGYLQAFAADSALDIEGRPDLTSLAEPAVQAVLHEQYLRYIKIPVVGLGVGYRFF